MPRKPRIIKAKYKTKCPKCDFPVVPGTTCKVYANEWYHMDCWNNKWEEVLSSNQIKIVDHFSKSKIFFILDIIIFTIIFTSSFVGFPRKASISNIFTCI